MRVIIEKAFEGVDYIEIVLDEYDMEKLKICGVHKQFIEGFNKILFDVYIRQQREDEIDCYSDEELEEENLNDY